MCLARLCARREDDEDRRRACSTTAVVVGDDKSGAWIEIMLCVGCCKGKTRPDNEKRDHRSAAKFPM